MQGNLNRAVRIVGFDPPPEAAAEIGGVHLHRVFFQTGERCCVFLHHGRALVRRPDLQVVSGVKRGCVHRLHRGVGEVRQAVFSLDHGCALRQRVHIAVIAHGGVGRIAKTAGDLIKDRVGRFGVGGGIPGDVNCIHGLLGKPGVGSHNRNGIAKIEDLFDTGHPLGLAGVKASLADTEMGALLDGCEFHAGQANVDAELCSACGFGHHIDAWHVLADQTPAGGGAQACFHRFDHRGGSGKGAVGQAGAIRGDDMAVLGFQLVAADTKLICRRLLERFAGAGACLAHPIKPVTHGRRAAGDLQVEKLGHMANDFPQRVLEVRGIIAATGQGFGHHGAVVIGLGCGAVQDRDLGWIDVQFLGDQARPGRFHPLSHLGPWRNQGDTGLIDKDKGVQHRAPIFFLKRIGGGLMVFVGAKGDATNNGSRADEKAAAGDLANAGHDSGLLHHLGGVVDGGADTGIGPAAAQVALHRLVDFCVTGRGVFCQEARGLHDLAGLAVPTLRHLIGHPGLLYGGHCVGGADPFDGGDVAPHIGQCHLTRANRLAIDMHCTGTAGGNAAAEFCAGQTDFIAQNPQERYVVWQINLMCDPVDAEGRGHAVSFLSWLQGFLTKWG